MSKPSLIKRILTRLAALEAAPGGAAITVKEEDGSPSVSDVSEIRISNGALTDNGGGSVSIALGSGSGDVTGPAGATDDDIVTFNGATGKLIQDGGSKISDLATASHNHAGVYEPANANIQSHISNTSNPHSVTLAQVGGTTDHTALSNIGTNTHAQIDTAITNSTNHIADSSDPHGSTLTQSTINVTTLQIGGSSVTSTAAELNKVDGYTGSAADLNDAVSKAHTQNTDTALGSGCVAADHGTAATDMVVNICYGTGAAPTASTTTEGTIYFTYTA